MASPASLGHSRGWLDTTGGEWASRLVPHPPSGSDLAAIETARVAAHESRRALLLMTRDNSIQVLCGRIHNHPLPSTTVHP